MNAPCLQQLELSIQIIEAFDWHTLGRYLVDVTEAYYRNVSETFIELGKSIQAIGEEIKAAQNVQYPE